MNIAFDATAILGPMSKNRGIGNYALSQFTGMINQDRNNHYFFMNMIEKGYCLGDLITNKEHFTEDFIDTGKDHVLLRNPAYAGVIGNVIRRYLRENNIDIFYITSPFESSYMLYQKEWFENVRVVVTVYDIIPYVMKHHYLADKTTYDWYMRCVDNLRWADELYVISESVKTDLIEYLHFPAEQIKVIWGAVDEKYSIIQVSEADKAALMKKFGVTKPFIMCTGGEDGRKNLDGLVRAYSLMPAAIRDKYQLVVVCKLSENGMKNLQGAARKAHVENDVIFTNFVTDKELLQFYNLASLMAFPSKYEGFGLPIVEAWACGTPVLTANNSSLAQIGGDAAVLVDADSDKSIAKGMADMLSDEAILRDYTERGAKRLELYRWEKINNDIIDLLNQITPCERPAAGETERPKIAFFTPLPPIESGISDYSEDIISELCKYCDIDVFIDDGYKPTSVFPENVAIYGYKEYPARSSQYMDTVYQMGNSDFHFYMYDFIRRYHGTVVLHDYNLHGAFYYRAVTVGRKDYALYRDFVRADYPDGSRDSYIESVSHGGGPDIFGIPLNSYLMDSADRIIVHSQEAKRGLLAHNIARHVEVIASYAVITPLADTAAVKEKNGYSREDTVLSAFGGISRTKRALPLLKAFAKLHKEFPQTKLLFAGKLADDIKSEFKALVREHELDDCVQVTGYIGIEQFKEFIDMTDICLNLRYPSNGETSGSLMRILAKGRCVVVNDIGSFSEIPDDACVKIENVEKMGEDREPSAIYEALRTLLEDPDEKQRIERAARQFAEEHLDLRIVAKHYYDYLCSECTEPAVTEELLDILRQDPNLSQTDISGIAGTLAYAV